MTACLVNLPSSSTFLSVRAEFLLSLVCFQAELALTVTSILGNVRSQSYRHRFPAVGRERQGGIKGQSYVGPVVCFPANGDDLRANCQSGWVPY